MIATTPLVKSLSSIIYGYLGIAIGAFLAAFSLVVFITPNNLIDGGVVGVAMILGQIFGVHLWPYFFIILNLPFLYLAHRYIGKTILVHMLFAFILFEASIFFIHAVMPWEFRGDSLEVVVIGGAILGVGLGMIIRYGGCIDGTEILGIIINRKTGITVGQVVFGCNIFVFGLAGLVFDNWHSPILSLITYIVVIKIMDSVIVGLDETKSVLIISAKSKSIAEAIISELGLGLTIMYGRGGFSGDEREIIYVIVERLQLAELKELIHREDPTAFIAIENLHEVASGKPEGSKKKSSIEALFSRVFKQTPGAS